MIGVKRDMKTPTDTIAVAVRIEHEQNSDRIFIVFEIIDEKFKQRVKSDWTQDLNLILIGKKLVISED